MIYSTGGVDRFVSNQQEIVTIPVKDVCIIPNNNSNNSGKKKILKRMVTFRSMRIVEGDKEDISDEDENDSLSFCTSNSDPFLHSPIKKKPEEVQEIINKSNKSTNSTNVIGTLKRLSITTPSPYKIESLNDGSKLIT